MAEIDFSQSYYLKRAASLGISLSLSTEIIIPRTKKHHSLRKQIITDGNAVHIAKSRHSSEPRGITIIPTDKTQRSTASSRPANTATRTRRLRKGNRAFISLTTPTDDGARNAKSQEEKKKKERKENDSPGMDGKGCSISSYGSAQILESRGDVGDNAPTQRANAFVARGGKSWMIVTEKMMEAYTP